MPKHRFILAAVVCGVALAGSPAARAQTTPAPGGQQDMLRMMHLAARNQLGVLEFCQGQGSVGQDVVDQQRKLMALLPAAQVDGLDEAEANGKRGIVVFAGSQTSLADAAQAQNTTVEAMCKQMGALIQAQAAQMPK